MIPGKEVEIGGTKYTLPPLNIPSLRKHETFLNKGPSFGKGGLIPTATDILEMAEIVRESFIRNYAEVDFEKVVEPHLDVPRVSECFTAVMTANAAGPATGESKPASP
jgi:hypothetical protein